MLQVKNNNALPNFFMTLAIILCCLGLILNLIPLYRLSVLAIAGYCISRGLQEPYLINPYLLFLATPISLLLYFSVGQAFMPKLKPSTWVLGIINMIAFLVGLTFTRDSRKGYCDEKMSISYFTILLLMVIGIVPAYYQAITGQDFPLASVINLFTILAFSLALKTKNFFVIAINSILFVSQFVIGYVSKMQVLMLILLILITFEKYFIKKRKQKIILAIFVVISFFVMIYAFTFANKDRGSYNVDVQFDYYASRVTWKYSKSLFMPYMYFCTPWGNLQYVTETQDSRTYGLWTLKPLISYMQLDKGLKEEYELHAYSSFNTFTFIAVEFKDFGFWGSMIISLLLGLYVKKIYSRYKISESALDVGCYSLVALSVMEMFFSNHFFSQSYPFTIVILAWLYWLFTKNFKSMHVR